MATKDVHLRLLVTAVNQAGAQLESVSHQLREVAARSGEVEQGATKLGTAGSAGANRFADSLNQLKERMESVSKAGDKLISIGTQLGMVGAGMMAAAVIPTITAAKFEKEMSAVKAVTLGTTTEFARLADAAKRLGRETKFTATEAAAGIKFLGMAGMNAVQALDAIEPALMLAAAGGLELAEAADIATNVLTGMSLKVSDLNHVVDALAYAAANSNTSVREMGEAFSYVAADIANAGMTIDQAAAFVGKLADAGVRATRGGTTMRGILLALGKVTPLAQRSLDKLRVTISKNADGTIDYIQTLEDLRKAGATVEDWANIFQRSFGGFAAYLSRSTDAIRQMEIQVRAADGAAKAMSATMQDNLIGALTRLSSAFEGFRLALGEPLLQPLAALVDGMAAVVRVAAEWAEQNPLMSAGIMGVVGALGALLVGVAALIIPLGMFMKLMVASVGGLASLVAFLPVAKAALVGFGAAAVAAVAAAGPLVTVLAALASIWMVHQVWAAINALVRWRREARKTADAAQELSRATKHLAAQFEHMKDYQLPKDLTKMADEDVEGLIDNLIQAELHYVGLKTLLREKIAKGRTWTGVLSKEAQEAQEDLKALNKKLAEFRIERQRVRAEQARRLIEKVGAGESEEEAAARRAALRRSEEMRIALIEDSVKRINELRRLELQDFKDSEELKILTVKEVQDRISLINQTYDRQVADARKKDSEDRQRTERELRAKEMAVHQQQLDNALELNKSSYDKGLTGLEEYLEKRRVLTARGYELEIEGLKDQIEKELDPDARRVMEFELRLVETRMAGDLSGLDTADEGDRDKQLQNERDFQMALKQIRIQAFEDTGDIQAAFDLEMELTETHNAQMLQMFRDMKIEESEIAKMAAEQQQAAIEKQAAFEKQVLEMREAATMQIASNLQSIFADLYEGSNKKLKVFFYLQRAVAMAEAIVSAYSASAKVMDSPIAKISPTTALVLSKTILAAGLARAAMIAATTIRAETGGLVKIKRVGGRDQVVLLDSGGPVQRFERGGVVRPSVMALSRRTSGPVSIRSAVPIQTRSGPSVVYRPGAVLARRFETGGLVTRPTARSLRPGFGQSVGDNNSRLEIRTDSKKSVVRDSQKLVSLDVKRLVSKDVRRFETGGLVTSSVERVSDRDHTVERLAQAPQVLVKYVDVKKLRRSPAPVLRFETGGLVSRSAVPRLRPGYGQSVVSSAVYREVRTDAQESLIRDVRELVDRDLQKSVLTDVRKSVSRDASREVRQSALRDVQKSEIREALHDVRESVSRDVRESERSDVQKSVSKDVQRFETGGLVRSSVEMLSTRDRPVERVLHAPDQTVVVDGGIEYVDVRKLRRVRAPQRFETGGLVRESRPLRMLTEAARGVRLVRDSSRSAPPLTRLRRSSGWVRRFAEGGLARVGRKGSSPPPILQTFAKNISRVSETSSSRRDSVSRDRSSTSNRLSSVSRSSSLSRQVETVVDTIRRTAPGSRGRAHPAEAEIGAADLIKALGGVTKMPTTTRSGLVRGEKGRDRIPAWLTDREYVVNAKAVQKYGVWFLEMINRGLLDARRLMTPAVSLPQASLTVRKGLVPRYETGGLVAASPATSDAPRVVANSRETQPTQYSVNVPVTVQGEAADVERLSMRLQDGIERTVVRILRETL